MAAAVPSFPVRTSVPLTEATNRQLAALGRHFQRVLARDPRNPQALIAMALVALAGRQTEAAERLARAAVDTAPGMTAAWVALGQALRAKRQFDAAEQAFEVATGLDSADPLALIGLAETALAGGRAEVAMARYQLALRVHPGMVPALLGMGNALGCLGRFAEALLYYEKVQRLRPQLAEAHFSAGFALARLNRAAEAEESLLRAIKLRPDFAAAWMNLGCMMREQGRTLEAEAALRRAVRMRPDLVSGWVNLALLAREAGLLDEAESHLRRAFAFDCESQEMLLAWARLCMARRDFAGANGWVRRALALAPEDAEAHNTLGILLDAQERLAEAVEAFDRAETLGSLPAISNRGNSLLDLGRMDEALEAHRAMVDRDPHHAGARYNLALTQLRMGQWREGWQNYEARWRFREVHRRPRVFACRRWKGEALSGERVLLHAEQGLGDTIQFCRYATLVAARGGRPVLQVQAPVARLLGSLAVVRAGLAEVALLDDPPPEYDLECPLMSLPDVFGTTFETVPWPGAYLSAETAGSVEEGRLASLLAGDDGLRVGLAWAGNPRYKDDGKRSVRLSVLLPLLRIAGVEWVSLQKGDAATQMAELAAEIPITDASSTDRDLADTAATIARLDAVVTTDTCIAHLAGAMAKPVFILLPHLADWRWMQGTAATPWYPTARLFRQPAPGDWASVAAEAARVLVARRRCRTRASGMDFTGLRGPGGCRSVGCILSFNREEGETNLGE